MSYSENNRSSEGCGGCASSFGVAVICGWIVYGSFKAGITTALIGLVVSLVSLIAGVIPIAGPIGYWFIAHSWIISLFSKYGLHDSWIITLIFWGNLVSSVLINIYILFFLTGQLTDKFHFAKQQRAQKKTRVLQNVEYGKHNKEDSHIDANSSPEKPPVHQKPEKRDYSKLPIEKKDSPKINVKMAPPSAPLPLEVPAEHRIEPDLPNISEEDRKKISGQIYLPGTRIGGYEIVSAPMKGGMGVVYFARDHDWNGGMVVLKTIKPEYLPDQTARDRFLREGSVWATLGRHPHIVQCLGVRNYNSMTLLVLELINKEQNMPDASLRPWLVRGKPLPLEQALSFSLQIARGMRYATEKIPSFVHRDLKPENILVGADKLEGTSINRLRVTDFGLVALLQNENKDIDLENGSERRAQLTQGILGTPLYMAPEQWARETVGIYTDVYAFGCIFYEMLASQSVVTGSSLKELQLAHCKNILRPLPDHLPQEVKSILLQCLALPVTERYQSWDDLTQELEHACLTLTGRVVSSEMKDKPLKMKIPAGTFKNDTDVELDFPSHLPMLNELQSCQSHMAIGRAYLNMGKAEVSIQHFEKALLIAKGGRYRDRIEMVFSNLETVYQKIGNKQLMMKYYEQYLADAREKRDRRAESHALKCLGKAYEGHRDLQRAIVYLEQSLAIAREANFRDGEEDALENLGGVYLALGNAQRAIEYFEQSLTMIPNLGNSGKDKEAGILFNLGLVYRSLLKDARRSIGYYEKSLVISREKKLRTMEGGTLENMANAYADIGDKVRAKKYYTEALAIWNEMGVTQGQSVSLMNLGALYCDLGNQLKAIECCQQALAILPTIDRVEMLPDLEWKILANLGNAHAEMREVKQAMNYYEQGLGSARKIGDRYGEGMLTGKLGDLYSDNGDAQRAIGYYEQQLEIAREIKNRREEGIALLNLAAAYRKLENTPQTITYYEQALVVLREQGNLLNAGVALNNLGNIYLDLGEAQRAIDYYEQALALRRKIGDQNGIASTLYNMARQYSQQGESAHALQLAQEATRVWIQTGNPRAQDAQQLVDKLLAPQK